MYIKPHWKVLTIGDGDLSFSRSLVEDHQHTDIVASTLDSQATIRSKYSQQDIDWLADKGINTVHQLDVLDWSSIPDDMKHVFDLIIFQFPLIPASSSLKGLGSSIQLNTNILNRLLVVNYIKCCFSDLLSPIGANLCYLTTKDVKPYSDWNLENLHPLPKGVQFLGQTEFELSKFPSYRIRNVERDKLVKATQSYTLVWGKDGDINLKLSISPKHKEMHCSLCGKGPFKSQIDISNHQNSKSHVRKANYEEQWLNFLAK